MNLAYAAVELHKILSLIAHLNLFCNCRILNQSVTKKINQILIASCEDYYIIYSCLNSNLNTFILLRIHVLRDCPYFPFSLTGFFYIFPNYFSCSHQYFQPNLTWLV